MTLIVSIVVLALIFDFINGFHDAANSIATVVSTRVLTPRWAVIWAGFFNFVAYFFIPLHVANAIGKGIIDPAIVDPPLLLGALTGAIIWNLLTWWWGLPSSSSHALMGGLIGAGICKGGMGVLGWPKITQAAIFIVASPVIGMLASSALLIGLAWILRRRQAGKVDAWFRRLQFVSSSLFSISHGGNDAQKTMGIISVLLFSTGHLGKTFHVPGWVALACYVAMGLGTMSGGWKIVKTMGMKLTKLKPFSGFCAETGGATAIFIASHFGIPVSTTHTITGAITGVGAVMNPSKVRWAIAGRIMWAWVFTIPASAVMAALTYGLVKLAGL